MHLIEFFSSFTHLPVHLDDVRDQVKEQCGIDEINFIAVDLDTNILLGMHRKYRQTIPGGQDHRVILDIYYAASIEDNLALKRLVICKELLHSADSDKELAQSLDAVDRLIEFIVIPPAAELPASVKSDHNGILYTLLVLLPRDALHILRPKHDAGAISVEDVARLAEIPEGYARLALSPIWEKIVEAI